MQYSDQWIKVSRGQLINDLKQRITSKRLEHVLRVEKTALELATLYNISLEKTSISALMHDYAKDMNEQEMLRLAKKQWDYPELSKANGNIWHGFAAATIARETYGVIDEEILEAIAAHTIGWYKMSILTQIIFIADYVEPERNFPGVEYARTLAYQNIDKAVGYKMTTTMKHLMDEEKILFLPTVEFYNQWILRSKDK